MVTLILTRIVFVLSIPLCLYAVYFGVVALFGLRKKLPAAPQAKPEKRFALVVAARNEAAHPHRGGRRLSFYVQLYIYQNTDIRILQNGKGRRS